MKIQQKTIKQQGYPDITIFPNSTGGVLILQGPNGIRTSTENLPALASALGQPTVQDDEAITNWICKEFGVDGLDFDESVNTQYGHLPDIFKRFAQWLNPVQEKEQIAEPGEPSAYVKKLWSMAKLITHRQKQASGSGSNIGEKMWSQIEEDWFDWLKEEFETLPAPPLTEKYR